MPFTSKLFLSNYLKKTFKVKKKNVVTCEDVSYKHSVEKKSEQ